MAGRKPTWVKRSSVLPFSRAISKTMSVPFGFVLDEIDLRIGDMPDNFLSGYPLRDLLGAAVKVLVAIRKFSAELIGPTVDLARPPSSHIVDGGKDFLRRLVDRKGRCVIFAHGLLLVSF